MDLKVSEHQENCFDEITSFNIRSRYDDIKMEFFHKCTREYTNKWILEIKALRDMDKKQAIKTGKRLTEYLKKEYDIGKTFLFGSYAKGNFNEDSDIDIAFVFKNISNTCDVQIQLMKIRRKFDVRIEPHPFEENEFNELNPLASEILKFGILI